MLQDVRPFRPFSETTATTVTQAVTATAATVAVPLMGCSVRVVNSGTQTIFIRLQSVAGEAATVANSMPMLAGTVETFFLAVDVVGLSVIAAATGSTAYFTFGTSA